MPKKMTHDELVKTALERPGVRQAYDELRDEFTLLEIMVKARKNSGKTQQDVANAMHTTTSVVGRLETAGGTKQHSPTISTLARYADAIGCRLMIKFAPKKTHSS